jgi:hypothetical protein
VQDGVCLNEGDLILEVNQQGVAGARHGRVVELLKECPVGAEATLLIQRGGGEGTSFCLEQPLSDLITLFTLLSLAEPSRNVLGWLG